MSEGERAAANPHVGWRLALGRRIAEVYAAHPKMEAVVVAGSVGAGWADQFSDVEIHAFWKEAPTDEDRRALARAAGARRHDMEAYEDDEWSDELYVPVERGRAMPPGGHGRQGSDATVQVGFSTFLAETLERWIENAVERFDPDIGHQLQIAAVQQSVTVSGHAVIERWRARAAQYPEGLRRAMVLAQLPFYHRWYGADMLAYRDDAAMLYGIAHTVATQVLGVLHGLNRVYVGNPDYKWLEQTAAQFSIAPPGLADRVRRVFRSAPAQGVATLQALCEETLDLVARELPDVDVSPYRERLRRRRLINEPPR